MSQRPKHSALFICLGNICRSTMAEAVFKHELKKRGVENEWFVDSAGEADYHLGKRPNEYTMSVLRKNGITDYEHHARQLCDEDFTKFEYIIGMDLMNMKHLDEYRRALGPERCTARFVLLGSYDPRAKNRNDAIIKDPYFEGRYELFETVYEQCVRSCANFLDQHATQ